MDERTQKKNCIFIVLIGIIGMCFGLLDWDSVISDLTYLEYSDKVLISVISAGISAIKIVATLICLKVSQAKRPNLVFYVCMITSSVLAIFCGVFFDNKLFVFFAIIYLLNTLILEIFSAYHYSYAHNSLPEEKALGAHSKRISVFKCTQAAGIAIASVICANIVKNTLIIISILVVTIFALGIIFTSQVKNNPVINVESPKNSMLKSLNIFKYSRHLKLCLVLRFLGKFALTSLIVLISLKMIDNGQDFNTLKITKSLLWVISGIGFFCSSYFMKKKKTVYYDFATKLFMVLLIPLVFVWPVVGFFIIIFKGINEPFNTMSNFELLRLYEESNCDLPQKELIINLFGYISGMLSSFVLLNVNFVLAITLICATLFISALLEIIIYIKRVSTIKKAGVSIDNNEKNGKE